MAKATRAHLVALLRRAQKRYFHEPDTDGYRFHCPDCGAHRWHHGGGPRPHADGCLVAMIARALDKEPADGERGEVG